MPVFGDRSFLIAGEGKIKAGEILICFLMACFEGVFIVECLPRYPSLRVYTSLVFPLCISVLIIYKITFLWNSDFSDSNYPLTETIESAIATGVNFVLYIIRLICVEL